MLADRNWTKASTGVYGGQGRPCPHPRFTGRLKEALLYNSHTMGNRDIQEALDYHEKTKHSLWSLQMDSFSLDFSNQPLPFKIYTDLESIPLPHESPASDMPALDAIASTGVSANAEGATGTPDLAALAGILFHTAGITKRGVHPGGDTLFRAAPCTGALYHIELYLVCGDLPELDAGVYHFGPRDFALHLLRRGDFRRVLAKASGGEPSLEEAPAILVFTSTFWRNAWKYRARAYRHCYWDSGVLLANLLAEASSHNLPAKVVLGFADDPVNHLLGLDADKEVSLGMVSLGSGSGAAPIPPDIPVISYETVPLSAHEVEYPDMGKIHRASSLGSGDEARSWRVPSPDIELPKTQGSLFHLDLDGALDEGDKGSVQDVPQDSIDRTIRRRGSSRQFVHRPMTFRQLSLMLDRSTRGIPADFLGAEGASLNQLHIIASSVDGLPPGSYLYRRDVQALEQLQQGDFRQMAGYLGLRQALPADAAVNIYMIADLDMALDRYGNRGYRAAQLEGGLIGGKLYLSAYAQRLGATGLTFFDDDVTTFFSPPAEGKGVMFLVAVGTPLRRRVRRPASPD